MANDLPPRKTPWDTLAEQRIREAQSEGKFDELPGFGRPIPGIDEPHDELWWVKDKLRREEISHLPPALAIRLDVERTLARLASILCEKQLRQELGALNERIRKASLGPTWGPPVDVMPIDIDELLARLRNERH
jgi:hypothetical protein